MYKIAKLTIKTTIENKDKAIDSLEDLLSTFYLNGQILNNWIIEDYKNYYEVRVTTTDDDSLDEKYYNQYIKDRLKNFQMSVQILADDACATDCCHCKEHSYYILAINPDDMSSPIICGDCGREIPLIRIPYLFNEEEHYSILNFQSIYKSVDNLWLNSLSDRFTKRQIIDHNSQLNKRGLDIRTELECKVGKPVYLLLANPIGGLYEFVKNNKNLDVCPKCGGKFRIIQNDYADKVCDQCRLAFVIHDETYFNNVK